MNEQSRVALGGHEEVIRVMAEPAKLAPQLCDHLGGIGMQKTSEPAAMPSVVC